MPNRQTDSHLQKHFQCETYSDKINTQAHTETFIAGSMLGQEHYIQPNYNMPPCWGRLQSNCGSMLPCLWQRVWTFRGKVLHSHHRSSATQPSGRGPSQRSIEVESQVGLGFNSYLRPMFLSLSKGRIWSKKQATQYG